MWKMQNDLKLTKKIINIGSNCCIIKEISQILQKGIMF